MSGTFNNIKNNTKRYYFYNNNNNNSALLVHFNSEATEDLRPSALSSVDPISSKLTPSRELVVPLLLTMIDSHLAKEV